MSLTDQLQSRRIEALVADAHFIRDWPDHPERTEQAQRLIRRAILLHTLGRGTKAETHINKSISISTDELEEVCRILDFAYEAMKPDIPFQRQDPLNTISLFR